MKRSLVLVAVLIGTGALQSLVARMPPAPPSPQVIQSDSVSSVTWAIKVCVVNAPTTLACDLRASTNPAQPGVLSLALPSLPGGQVLSVNWQGTNPSLLSSFTLLKAQPKVGGGAVEVQAASGSASTPTTWFTDVSVTALVAMPRKDLDVVVASAAYVNDQVVPSTHVWSDPRNAQQRVAQVSCPAGQVMVGFLTGVTDPQSQVQYLCSKITLVKK